MIKWKRPQVSPARDLAQPGDLELSEASPEPHIQPWTAKIWAGWSSHAKCCSAVSLGMCASFCVRAKDTDGWHLIGGLEVPVSQQRRKMSEHVVLPMSQMMRV